MPHEFPSSSRISWRKHVPLKAPYMHAASVNMNSFHPSHTAPSGFHVSLRRCLFLQLVSGGHPTVTKGFAPSYARSPSSVCVLARAPSIIRRPGFREMYMYAYTWLYMRRRGRTNPSRCLCHVRVALTISDSRYRAFPQAA